MLVILSKKKTDEKHMKLNPIKLSVFELKYAVLKSRKSRLIFKIDKFLDLQLYVRCMFLNACVRS